MSAKPTYNALGRQFQHVTQANNLITLMATHESPEQLAELLRKYDHHIGESVRTAAERGQSDGVIAGYIRQNNDLLAANIRFEQRARDAEALAAPKVEQEPDALEAFTQSLAFGRMRLVSHDQCWTSKQATALLLSLLCARLAPASDELLKALEEIRGLGSDGEHSGDRHARCRQIARAAIAQHKGPQS